LTSEVAASPTTMAIWFTATIRPRMCAGVTSAMYMGVEMEAMPMPTPPRIRNAMKTQISRGSAVPMAEAKNIAADRSSAGLRPNLSERGPTSRTPAAQPMSTQPEAQPFMASPRANRAVRGSMAPEMTPVS
jgi:hypothetical protein